MHTPGASGDAGDPLGDPTVALRGSHHCRIGSTTGNYVEYRVVPYQAVSASRICPPPVSQACGYPESMRGVWHHHDRRRQGQSGFSCAPRVIGSRSVNKNDSVRPSRQMRHTSSVEVAYHCAEQVRDVFHQATPAQGRRLATHLIKRLPTCPIPEIARLGRTLRTWKDALDAYFDTAGASNAPHRSHQRTLSN